MGFPEASMPLLKNDMLRMAETNVPGRNNMVIVAMVIMEELSRRVASAMRLEVCAMERLVLLSDWLARLK